MNQKMRRKQAHTKRTCQPRQQPERTPISRALQSPSAAVCLQAACGRIELCGLRTLGAILKVWATARRRRSLEIATRSLPHKKGTQLIFLVLTWFATTRKRNHTDPLPTMSSACTTPRVYFSGRRSRKVKQIASAALPHHMPSILQHHTTSARVTTQKELSAPAVLASQAQSSVHHRALKNSIRRELSWL